MAATWRTLPPLTKWIFVVGLLVAVVSVQAGYAPPPVVCTMAGAPAMQRGPRPMSACHHCGAAMPCCKTGADAPAQPEPLNDEHGRNVDHAPVAVTLILIPTFDFLASLRPFGIPAGDRVVQPACAHASRGAVSCIWLI